MWGRSCQEDRIVKTRRESDFRPGLQYSHNPERVSLFFHYYRSCVLTAYIPSTLSHACMCVFCFTRPESTTGLPTHPPKAGEFGVMETANAHAHAYSKGVFWYGVFSVNGSQRVRCGLMYVCMYTHEKI